MNNDEHAHFNTWLLLAQTEKQSREKKKTMTKKKNQDQLKVGACVYIHTGKRIECLTNTHPVDVSHMLKPAFRQHLERNSVLKPQSTLLPVKVGLYFSPQ